MTLHTLKDTGRNAGGADTLTDDTPLPVSHSWQWAAGTMGSAPFCLGIINYPINLPKTNRGRLVFNISPTGGPQQQGGGC